MSIKFPDMQVLLSRTDQIPKTTREGDPTGAGKLAPQIGADFQTRQRKINNSPRASDLRNKKEKEERKRGKKSKKRGNGPGQNLDVKA